MSDLADAAAAAEGITVQSQLCLWVFWGNIAINHEAEASKARQRAMELKARAGKYAHDLNREFESVLVTVTACANALEALYGGLLAHAPTLARPDNEHPDWRKVWRTLDACFSLGSFEQASWPARFSHLFVARRNAIVHFKEPARSLAPHPVGITISPEYSEYSLEEARQSVNLLLDVLTTCGSSQARSEEVDAYREDVATNSKALMRGRLKLRS